MLYRYNDVNYTFINGSIGSLNAIDPDSDSSTDENNGESDDDIVDDEINAHDYEQKLRHILNWLSNAEKTLEGIQFSNELKTTVTQFNSFEVYIGKILFLSISIYTVSS